MLIQLWQSTDVIQFAKKGKKVVDCMTSLVLLNPLAPETKPCYTHYYHSNDDEGCSSISTTQTTYTCAHNLLVVYLARVNGQGKQIGHIISCDLLWCSPRLSVDKINENGNVESFVFKMLKFSKPCTCGSLAHHVEEPMWFFYLYVSTTCHFWQYAPFCNL